MTDPQLKGFKGFLVFRGVDRLFVIFGTIGTDRDNAAVIYLLEDGTPISMAVPFQHVIGVVIGETAAHADAAIMLCGDEQPTLLPPRSNDETPA